MTTIVIGNYGRLHVENIRYHAPPVPSVSLSAGSPRTRHHRVSALLTVVRSSQLLLRQPRLACHVRVLRDRLFPRDRWF
ncbi:unnamed protein product [Macrosiphum euphorbiae]|uniref:Uncharacterized protein n=1 Tax=Macrosiphum euphorbiae TaxID=13131 RepID=A0AAV0Y3C9_9HEMI|nr:unnamed protein product [Macrosiphum euphorbiae]